VVPYVLDERTVPKVVVRLPEVVDGEVEGGEKAFRDELDSMIHRLAWPNLWDTYYIRVCREEDNATAVEWRRQKENVER